MTGRRKDTSIVQAHALKPSQRREITDEKQLKFSRLYPNLDEYVDIKVHIHTGAIGKLILKGYRYCPRCKVMINTNERICKGCGYAFRTRTTQSKSFGKVESIGLYPQSSLADRLKGNYNW